MVSQSDAARARKESEREKKFSRFIGKHFFTLAFLIGLLITSAIGGGLFLLYRYAPSHSFNPNYRGFAIARNHTQSLIPYTLSVQVFVSSEKPKLYFRYDFAVAENGSYNFILIFPFNVTQMIRSTESMNFNVTPYGTAIWTKRQITDVGIGWRGDYVWGDFYIVNTFQSGTRGDYIFALPFFGGVGGSSDIIDRLQDELNVVWHSPDARVELEFVVPSRFKITQAYPRTFLGPDTLEISGNRTISRVQWSLSWPDQQFTIFCQDKGEIAHYESLLFLSGLFLSVGASIIVRSAYDAAKEKYHPNTPTMRAQACQRRKTV